MSSNTIIANSSNKKIANNANQYLEILFSRSVNVEFKMGGIIVIYICSCSDTNVMLVTERSFKI